MNTKLLFLVSALIFTTLSFAQVGIGNTNPQATLDIEASDAASPANNDGVLIPRMSNFPPTPGATRDGMLIFYTGASASGKGFYYWNQTTTNWIKIGSGDKNTLDEAYDQGGAGTGSTIDATDGAVTINGEDGLLITGTFGSGDDVFISGSGTRLFFNPKKAAFRAGHVENNEWDNLNIGDYSIGMGYNTLAGGDYSSAFGYYSQATGTYATALGFSANANSDYSVAIGAGVEASGNYSTAFGYFTDATGESSTAMGRNTVASGYNATAIGENTIASLNNSTAMGYQTQASGVASTAMGHTTIASGTSSIAMGHITEASGDYSMASGWNTTASGGFSASMGDSTLASGFNSTAMGDRTVASGYYSTAMGRNTEALSYAETSLGYYNNNPSPNSTSAANNADQVFSIGNGSNNTNRSNALTIYKSGLMNINDAYNMPLTDGTANQLMITDGSGQVNFVDASTLDNGNTLDEAYDQGGAGIGKTIDATDGAVTIEGQDGILITGTHGSGETITTSGIGTRMFFNPRKSAFRAGRASISGSWDDANVGEHSFAGGLNTVASGQASISLGFASRSFGNVAFSTGFVTYANSYAQTTVGIYNRNTPAISTNSWEANDELFVVGNGTFSGVSTSNALTIYKSGLMNINDEYDMPLTDGTANQVMSTDGTGHVSFVDVSSIFTDTDNQTIDQLSLSGTTLNISLEDDGQTTQTVDLSSLNNSNTLDEAYNQGGVGAGKNITANDGAVRINGEDGFLVTGTFNSGNTIDTEITGAGTRLFFNPLKSAFRAGTVDGNQWNDTNIGNYSAAFGRNNTVSGSTSAAFGLNNTVSSISSTAFGENNSASGAFNFITGTFNNTSGENSVAIGQSLTVAGDLSTSFGASNIVSTNNSFAIGNRLETYSRYETVFGTNNTSYTANSTSSFNVNDRLFVIGNGANTTSKSNALTIYKSGLLNINDEYDMPLTDGTANQVMSTDGVGHISFVDATAIFTDTDTQNTLDEAYNQGGAGAGKNITANDGAVRINGEDGFLVTGAFGSGNNIDTEITGAGTRMFFNPNKAAFRAGRITGAQWDDANIGEYSAAMGRNTVASGESSTASGRSSIASGYSSVAMGFDAEAIGNQASIALGYSPNASGTSSVALGFATTASGTLSTAIGNRVTSPSYGETSMGYFNSTYTPNNTSSIDNADRVFSIGNGIDDANRSNALTIYKSGLLNINDEYNMPLTDGAANQVMATDGAGVVSFVDPSTLITNDWTTTGNSGTDYTTDFIGTIDNEDLSFRIHNTEHLRLTTTGQLEVFNTGAGAIFIGENAGENTSATSSSNSIFIGKEAGFSNTSGISNVAIGDRAMLNNSNGQTNIGIGTFALSDNTTGDGNIAIGFRAGRSTQGSNNTFLGYDAGAISTIHSKSGSVFIGHQAGYLETDSDRLYIDNSNTTNPLIYGEFDNNILRANGEFQIGDPSSTGFSFPLIDGIANQVMMTDGAGNVSFSNLIEENTTASNGLTEAGNDIRLGGALTEATTISNGANALNIDLNNTGDFNIQDNGTNKLTVLDNGDTVLGGNQYWRVGNTSGGANLLARLIDDGDDGLFQIYENNLISIHLNANGTSVFNEQGLDRNFRVESDDEENMLFVDAGNNNVGIAGTPNVDFHVFHRTDGATGGFKLQNSNANDRFFKFFVSQSTTNPRLLLYSDVSGETTSIGNFNATTGAYTATSDRRLKKDFKSLYFDWTNFMNLETLTYRYKKDPSDKEYIGLVAQDVEKIYPELINYVAEDDIYHMDYAATGVIAIKAVQELKNEVDNLKKENAKLKSQLNKLESLEARLEVLENNKSH